MHAHLAGITYHENGKNSRRTKCCMESSKNRIIIFNIY